MRLNGRGRRKFAACGKSTHCYPCRDKIDLVQNINQLLVRLFLPQIINDRFTPCSKRVSSIENVNDNVGRIENLVKFTPNTPRCTLGVNWFGSERSDDVVQVYFWSITVGGIYTAQA